MKNHNSAIMQMVYGKRGNVDNINFSEDYQKSLRAVSHKIEAFVEQLKQYPQLLQMYRELEEAIGDENAIYVNEVYREAFAYGLTIGQEVFGELNKLD